MLTTQGSSKLSYSYHVKFETDGAIEARVIPRASEMNSAFMDVFKIGARSRLRSCQTMAQTSARCSLCLDCRPIAVHFDRFSPRRQPQQFPAVEA